MTEIKRVKIDSLLESQIPEFLSQEAPLFVEFLRQYYKSLENQSGAIDLAVNLKKYKNIEKFNSIDLKKSTTLTSDILAFDDVIPVESTLGWPDSYGLLKINNEIITYISKSDNTFNGCIRGFSGIDRIESLEKTEFLNFSETETSEHESGSIVLNLSNLFLTNFFEKFKTEFFPGFENRDFSEGLSIENILTSAKDFYISKGTDSSYKLLFKILYGTDIEIIKPQDYTLVPSSNSFFSTKNILVEKISGGDPISIRGNFLYQDVAGVGTVSASIFNVEYRRINNKTFYEISLDSTSLSGNFEVSGKTKIMEDVNVGSTNILVDSTIGFSKNGKILVKPENSDFIELTYGDKTTNQFLDVSGITKELKYGLDIVENKFAFSYVGLGNTTPVNFRIINVIDNVDFSSTSNMRVADRVKLSGFGKNLINSVQFNSWIYNLPTTHNIQLTSQVDTNKFRIILYDFVPFYQNEVVELIDENDNEVEVKIITVEFDTGDKLRRFSNRILIQNLDVNFDINKSKYLRKKIYKTNHYSNYFPEANIIPTGVQNTYIDNTGSNFYVTSTGTPNYPIFVTDNKKNVITQGTGITTTFYSQSHNYISGDVIYYNALYPNSGISTGYYYVTKVDSNNFKLSYSKSDIFSKKYISVKSGITSDISVKSGFENKTLKNQKIVKKFPLSANSRLFDDPNKRTINDRSIGLLVNGVELLSPTLFDENIYYGSLQSIEVINNGEDYDVVTPPPIEILDDNGRLAKAHPNLSGSIKRIKIISPGVGYQSKPKITISGGNGRGCSLESNLVKSRIESGFKADSDVSILNNTITFLNRVLFEDGEEIIYNSNTNSAVPGFVDGAHYYVGIVTGNVIKLYTNTNDSINKQNEINISGIGSGIHYLSSLKNKNTITEVYVKDSGQGYSNRKIKVPSILSANNKTIGINTFDSYFFAKNHGFLDGDLVEYSSTNTPISGLSTAIYYYVNVIDSNKFRLASAGIGTTLSNLNFIEKKYVKFNNLGLGTHIVGYPPIKIEIESTSAIGSTTIIEPILEPIVLGTITDVYLEDGGVSYGCTDIINFHKRPNVGVSSIKSQAILKPIVINGTIVDVKIINKGRGYRKDSDIVILGSGSFAEIDPIVDSEGRLSSVNILNGGIGYGSSDTQLILANRGINAKFLGNVTEWKINQVVKLKNEILPEDDGFIYPNKNVDLGLQYINFYIPKKLRYSLSDNFTETNKEITGKLSHSPILGYAYDGNPIYGPYGFDSTLGGPVRQIKSSYVLDLVTDSQLRPQSFEPGYFINDYTYNSSNDLDENNGRFCVTPQYPNGTYAYFYSVSIDATNIATPVYPYIIGTRFYDLPIEDNFIPKFNQDFDLFDTTLSRNVAPYYLENTNSFYELIDKVSDEYKQEFRVSEIESSSIEGVSIFSPGNGYKVNDFIILDNDDTSGTGANIVVSEVKGKDVSEFSITSQKIENISFIIRGTKVTGICDSPHELVNDEIVLISGISTITSSSLEGLKKIQVTDKTVELLGSIDILANTGISTFISVKDVSGFRDNDFIGIGTEKLLITKVSSQKSGFYVNRIENTGVHTVGIESVKLLPKIFEFEIDAPLNDFTLENVVTFFDPKETVGTGTAGVIRSIVGLGTSSIESRFIPPKSIYLPGHKFFTGQELIYNPGVASTSLYVNNVGSGLSFKLEQDQKVYAVNLGKNYLGLSTLGFTTSSGIGTNLNSLEFWDLTEAFGVIGYAHSLKTINPQITGTLKQSLGIVTTTHNHELQSGDNIEFNITSTSTNEVKVKYDIINRKVLTNEILFSNSNVLDGTDSTINLSSSNIKIKTGDKVVYFASTPIGGLVNGGIYYVLKENDDKIKLCDSQTDVKKSNNIIFSSTGSSSQQLYFVNPPLEFFKGGQIKFDLSDSSLLDMDLYFYSDSQCSRRLDIIGSVDDTFAIFRSGTPGNNQSYVSLDTSNKHFPSVFYYNLISKSSIEESKQQISFDTSVLGNNKVKIVTHSLNSKFIINVVDNKKISFNINKELNYFELLSLTSSSYTYTTNSLSASGPIHDLRINFGGRGYKKLPYIRSINTSNGSDAVIQLISPKVGRVASYERIKDGFDYPTDPTLSPRLSIPTVCGIKDIRTIEKINITSGGRGYNNPPELLVKDDTNIKLLGYLNNGSVSKVDILQNSTSLSEPLEIISIRNSNGYEIDNITYLSSLVTLELSNTPGSTPLISVGYGSTEILFPFSIGDEIFIENCRLTSDTQQNANFNSSSYNYSFFPVVGVNTSNNTITYDMTGISTGSFGTYSDELNLGMVINKKDMPVLVMILNDDTSYKSTERVVSKTFSANVMENGWDNKLNQLRLNDCFGALNIGDKLYGENSKLEGIVEYFNTFDLNSTLGPFRDKVAAIDNAVGILNDYQQRISDNFYYQKFAYSIKSDIPYSKWRESVRSTVHPSGFKEFSDLIIYTEPTVVGSSNSTNMRPKILQTDSSLSVNIDNEVSVYDRSNFVRVYEDTTLEDGSVESVYFNDGINLRPFILNKTNKVLRIDDISNQFDGSSLQEIDGRYADASDLLQSNRDFIMEEVVGFITATYPGITTNIDWDRDICKRDVGYIVDAVSHDVKYKSNNKSIEAGLAYWSGVGTSYVSGETLETISGFNYIVELSKYIINNVGVKTSYQLGSTIGISSVVYNNVTGIATVVTSTTHGLSTTTKDYVLLKNLVFSCDSGGGINTAIFPNLGNGPDGNGPLSPKGFVYEVEIIDATRFRINPGPSTITHNYVNGGTIQKAFISTTQYTDPRILFDETCSPTYSENCCADVWTSIGNYVGIITSIIGIGTTSAPSSIVYPSLTRGGQIVGLTTFKLKNKGTSLFSHSINSSNSEQNYITLSEDLFIIPNHNFQTGHELIYETTGTPIGIATTSYVVGITSVLMKIDNTSLNGTAILEQGYPVAIQTSITGVSTVLVPAGPSFREYLQVIGLATNGIGTDAKFNAFISYSISTGQPISTSLVLVSGGSGYSVGDTVSIAGTYLGGTSPTNDLTFVVSNVGPTGIQTRANEVYTNVPSNDFTGSLFNVTRNSSGYVSNVDVVYSSSGYAYTSTISIAGTYLGGSTNDYISFVPSELGTNVLPKSLFVYKLNDNSFRVFGLSTSTRSLNITGLGSGQHVLSYKDANSSSIISIDGVVQSPLTRKSLIVSLGSSVSTATTNIIHVTTGISSLKNGDILNLSEEYLLVKSVGITSSNFVNVERAFLGSTSGVHTVGVSATVLTGNFNIIKDVIYFTTAPYGNIGQIGLQTGSIFSGRAFSRAFDASQQKNKNIILDDISLSFTGIAATEFTLKNNNQNTEVLFNDVNNATNISNNPFVFVNNVFQVPQSDYTIDGTPNNVIRFLSGTPAAGKISKVAITTGFGYQPRIGASATVSVSPSGTISTISLLGSGSGYRNPPVISIASTIGTGASFTAIVGAGGSITGFTIVNSGFGYTSSSLPVINIGIPTGYSNLPVSYIGGSSGVGQGAKVTVEVGMGSSIISFKFDEVGKGYKVGDILSVSGITTNPSVGVGFSEFRITVEEVETDKFSSFYPGQFILFEDISSNFNGFRKKFSLLVNVGGVKQTLSLKTLTGSDLDITNNIFIFVNDILQSPLDSYTFQGSRVSFKEAPKAGSKCTILYYRGSSIDVEEIDPPKTIKIGDEIVIEESTEDLFDITQFERVVKKITSSDQLDTFTYNSIGINTDSTKNRPLLWKKQKRDRIINGTLYSKARPNLQSLIKPNASLIKDLSSDDTSIYVDTAFPFFSGTDTLTEDLRDVVIFDNKDIESARATSIVSTSSTVSSINIEYPGIGYGISLSPVVNISLSAIKLKDPIYEWQGSNIIGVTTFSKFNSVISGKRILAVGNSSLYADSVDGIEWQVGNVGLGSTTNFKSVHSIGVGNSDIIISVGSLGKIAKSVGYSNTISNWTEIDKYVDVSIPGFGVAGQQLSGYSGTLNDITYSSRSNTWVTVGAAGSIFVGSGIHTDRFINRFSRTLRDLNSVAFGTDYFVAIGNDGTIVSSNTGLIWELNQSPVVTNLNKVIYANNRFIIVGNNGVVLRSVTRDSYEVLLTNLIDDLVNVKYYYGFYVVVTSSGNIFYSFDLLNWVPRSTLQGNQITDLIFDNSLSINGRYIAVGASGTTIYADPVIHRATAISGVNSLTGIVTSITIIDGGFGYSQSEPPAVMIEPDKFLSESIKSIKVKGDHGVIIGINTFISGTPGIGTTSPKIEFVLKSESYDNSTLGIGYSALSSFGINNSQLEKGDYFVITDSNVLTGSDLIGITTFLGGMSNFPNSIVGIAKSFIDGVYCVENVTTPNSGIVTVTCHFAPMVDNYIKVYKRGETNSGIGTNDFYGRYSWGKIYDFQNRTLSAIGPLNFYAQTQNGTTGLSTSPKVIRTRGLLSN
jgi:hypothetical protein